MTTEPQVQRWLLQKLQSLQRAGVLDLPRPNGAEVDLPEWITPQAAQRSAAPLPSAETGPGSAAAPRPTETPPPVADKVAKEPQPTPVPSTEMEVTMPVRRTASRQDRAARLEVIAKHVATCRRCRELATTRTQTVFGVGNPQPRLVFLGEAPGADEDQQGEPFVGRAGQLLNKILEACGMQREDVYILNILKCRPPGNRNPSPEEAGNCREYLLAQLEVLQPEFICCLGTIAAQNLLETTTPIGQLRGRIHHFGSIQVVATYHPAYLLRNPSAKRATWDDMKMLLGAMGLPVPEK